ncbi:GH32 C-terminal domain-containing protein [Phytomonospora endophytica]|uniref:Fructan beta-fructosidase n=1 Tax=Phytomonospora endophytica TaxID=714109 RepID=A0A841FQK2_9ACTN|nr:glycoside hydrolase family 32 protein [Phytomonospora endophytica]MBB6034839.1 fructan beta-fructosidase [Phytomonospora endophytica]GIG68957.1 levanase [Phytomonospora endophytica]
MSGTRRALVRLVTLLAALALLVPAAPASAGTPGEYPEFPYPATGYDEPERGQFHFTSRGGWMNDVNAPLYHQGQYHLFYQHNPHGLAWDTMHWGHATSPDLVHWTQRPVALEPGVHPGDLWSGGGVVDTANTSGLGTAQNPPIVVFSGTNGVRVFYSTDGARTFQAYDGGRPVAVPQGTSRDPKVVWHAATQRWSMVVWSDAGGNGVDVYTSPDLLHWSKTSRFAAGWLFECPDLYPLPVDGDASRTRWVLNDASGEYVTGDFDGAVFRPDQATPQRMDHGPSAFDGTIYAGLTFQNTPGSRVVQMAWMPRSRGSSWTGAATFPVTLGLKTFADGVRLTRTPVAELSSLRYGSRSYGARTLTGPQAWDLLAGVEGDTFEVLADFDAAASTAARFGFRSDTRADGSGGVEVGYDKAAGALRGAPLAPVNGRVRMRLLVDRDQLEVFAGDGRYSYTDTPPFDRSPDTRGLRLFATGGDVRLVSLEVHRLASAWNTAESTLSTNLPGTWRPAGGAWRDVGGGKRGSAAGDAFYLNDTVRTDFAYEADVSIVDGRAAALTFRASADVSGHYTVNVDADGYVRLWRPGQVLATVPFAVARDRWYHLKVVAQGARLRVYLDHSPAPLIDLSDTAYAGGRLGVNVYAGTGDFQNARVDGSAVTGPAGPWTPLSGAWTAPGALRGAAVGDGFYLSSLRGGDFTYGGDLRLTAGRAAALTFRASPDGSGHYTANVDTAGYVKLWRPGADLAVVPAVIVAGRTYRLTVVASGPRIRVFLDGVALVDVTDGAYASGFFGLNVFDGTATFSGVTVS